MAILFTSTHDYVKTYPNVFADVGNIREFFQFSYKLLNSFQSVVYLTWPLNQSLFKFLLIILKGLLETSVNFNQLKYSENIQ